METSRTFLVILQDFRKKRQNFVDNPIDLDFDFFETRIDLKPSDDLRSGSEI